MSRGYSDSYMRIEILRSGSSGWHAGEVAAANGMCDRKGGALTVLDVTLPMPAGVRYSTKAIFYRTGKAPITVTKEVALPGN